MRKDRTRKAAKEVAKAWEREGQGNILAFCKLIAQKHTYCAVLNTKNKAATENFYSSVIRVYFRNYCKMHYAISAYNALSRQISSLSRSKSELCASENFRNQRKNPKSVNFFKN